MLIAAHAIEEISEASGTNEKLSLLWHYKDVEGLKEILRFVYNPYCKTGIAAAKMRTILSSIKSFEPDYGVTWRDAIQYFSTHQTGADADLVMARKFIISTQHMHDAKTVWLAKAMLTQNLKIGVSTASLNKVFGKDFIPKTGCMLGTLYGDVGPIKTAWPCIVTEKLDGIRRILIKEDGVCRFYSRSGHEDTGLIEIQEEAKYLPNNFVYDGELLAAGTFKDNIALRQATNSIANSKGLKTGLTLNVFDMLPLKDFYAGISKQTALDRKIRLGATFRDDSIGFITEDPWRIMQAFGIHEVALRHIKVVPILGLVHNIEEVTPIVENIWAHGGEGVMLNTVSGKYEIKRSKSLLKVKHTEEVVLQVVGMTEGTNKYEDTLGALVVTYKGSNVGVGSGFTDSQRRDIWENPDSYIGRKIEVECFGESINQQGYVSLNCPVFKRFVGDKE